MKRIIYTPGKNIKPPEEAHCRLLLRCLLHSIDRIDAQVAAEIESSGAFSVVPWNYYFYNEVRDINRDIPWVERLLSIDEPDPADIKAARPLAYKIAKFLYQLGDSFHWLIPLIPDRRIKNSIRDTEKYFANRDNVACRVREFLKEKLREAYGKKDKVLLIGHSMGSIIAFDSLWELHHLEGIHHSVDCLLTTGSPLGMNYVQRRLANRDGRHPDLYPGNIRKWVNISARGDLVALDPSVANDFHDMVTRGYVESIEDHTRNIHNFYRDEKGLNVHKSYGYLCNPVVAQTVIDWWKSA